LSRKSTGRALSIVETNTVDSLFVASRFPGLLG